MTDKDEVVLIDSHSYIKAVTILRGIPLTGNYVFKIERRKKTRTLTQNRCIHLYCTQLATALNDAGYDQVKLLGLFKHGFEVPHTMESIKHLFQQISETLTGQNKTSMLSTVEMKDVYKVFDMGIARKTGVQIDWPHDEPPLLEEHKIS